MPTPPPHSPSSTPSTHTPPTSPSNPSSSSPFHSSPTTNAPLSDIPRLRTTHSTAGYRDGIASSKESTLQAGFDEGYPLGAEFGLRVGWVLGVLEGVERALERGSSSRGPRSSGAGRIVERIVRGAGHVDEVERETGGEGDAQGIMGDEGGEARARMERERERVGKMLKEAREELGVERVFGGEWWRGDGWVYEVLGKPAEGESGEIHGKGQEEGIRERGEKGKREGDGLGKEKGDGDEAWGKREVTFKEVVDCHPVLREWVGRVRREMDRWGIREDGGFGGAEWEAGRVEGVGG